MQIIMIKQQRTCMPISWYCDNRCLFCMDDWTKSKYILLDEINNKLDIAIKYSKEITFSSLEPTLHPNIFAIINLARLKWFEKIELVTNWNKLSDYKFSEELVKCWVNIFSISIHSHIPKIHDYLVWNNWAFNSAIKWLINLKKINKINNNISIGVWIVINKYNYYYIYETVKFFQNFILNDIVINVIQYKNYATRNIDKLFINYKKIWEKLLTLYNLQNKYWNIYINWLTKCVIKNMNLWYFNWAQINPSANWFDLTFNQEKIKFESCLSCNVFYECDWVWQSYVDKFWNSEFLPIIDNKWKD